mmetsp:Transcript_1413/g.3171  ORF Transcript_1413/g.3171 Transcript_1413/m.3171 type:complete len:207 (-) Transcript_1413:738-1358(-)
MVIRRHDEIGPLPQEHEEALRATRGVCQQRQALAWLHLVTIRIDVASKTWQELVHVSIPGDARTVESLQDPWQHLRNPRVWVELQVHQVVEQGACKDPGRGAVHKSLLVPPVQSLLACFLQIRLPLVVVMVPLLVQAELRGCFYAAVVHARRGGTQEHALILEQGQLLACHLDLPGTENEEIAFQAVEPMRRLEHIHLACGTESKD